MITMPFSSPSLESKQYSSSGGVSGRAQFDRDGANKPYSRQARDGRQEWRQQKNSRYDVSEVL